MSDGEGLFIIACITVILCLLAVYFKDKLFKTSAATNTGNRKDAPSIKLPRLPEYDSECSVYVKDGKLYLHETRLLS